MAGSGPRRPNREVELEDIIWQGVLGGADDGLDILLRIHLALEAILIELLSLSQSTDSYLRWAFPTKTEYLVAASMMTPSDKLAFDRLNDARNDAAHVFGHRLTVSSALALASDLEVLGVDFSDSLSNYTEAQVVEYYDGLRGILAEIGWCVLCHAAYLLSEAGGRDIFSGEARA